MLSDGSYRGWVVRAGGCVRTKEDLVVAPLFVFWSTLAAREGGGGGHKGWEGGERQGSGGRDRREGGREGGRDGRTDGRREGRREGGREIQR